MARPRRCLPCWFMTCDESRWQFVQTSLNRWWCGTVADKPWKVNSWTKEKQQEEQQDKSRDVAVKRYSLIWRCCRRTRIKSNWLKPSNTTSLFSASRSSVASWTHTLASRHYHAYTAPLRSHTMTHTSSRMTQREPVPEMTHRFHKSRTDLRKDTSQTTTVDTIYQVCTRSLQHYLAPSSHVFLPGRTASPAPNKWKAAATATRQFKSDRLTVLTVCLAILTVVKMIQTAAPTYFNAILTLQLTCRTWNMQTQVTVLTNSIIPAVRLTLPTIKTQNACVCVVWHAMLC